MKFVTTAFIIWLTMLVLCMTGYILNLVALIQASSFGALEAARAIGLLFAPLGVLLGYFF